jgi:hypothetical protein
VGSRSGEAVSAGIRYWKGWEASTASVFLVWKLFYYRDAGEDSVAIWLSAKSLTAGSKVSETILITIG